MRFSMKWNGSTNLSIFCSEMSSTLYWVAKNRLAGHAGSSIISKGGNCSISSSSQIEKSLGLFSLRRQMQGGVGSGSSSTDLSIGGS